MVERLVDDRRRGHEEPATDPLARRLPDRGPLLNALPSSSVARLVAASRVEQHAPRSTLAVSGAGTGRCWLVIDGHVKEHRRLRDGTDVLVDIRGPGDLVGEAAALRREPIGVDVSTLDDATLLVLDADLLTRAMADDHAVATAVREATTARIAATQRLLVRNARHDMMERVVLALLDLEERFGQDVATGRWIGVPISQQELASWAGMSRESFAKVLRRLRREGLVITSRCDIVLPDVVTLGERIRTPGRHTTNRRAAVPEPAR